MKDQINDTQDNLTKKFGIISHQTCGRTPKIENEQFFHSESFSSTKMIAKIKYGINSTRLVHRVSNRLKGLR